ncbi:hypothetical protein BCR43DRAFT_525974 [Syncephalastrum racemosum]|uniref:Invertebrate defensins family profile domain-containing protein n=1 Tax=Syncephalastrum racemosum TaxID=13706 RepID=A0A1X2H8G0_SYNRA|nr:hypothetical protein BCR43DRAFT_525974 [Syncephalastrum racemosum]
MRLLLQLTTLATAFLIFLVAAVPLNGDPVTERKMHEKLAYTGLNSQEEMTLSKRLPQAQGGSNRDECIRNCEENKNGKVHFCITKYCKDQ